MNEEGTAANPAPNALGAPNVAAGSKSFLGGVGSAIVSFFRRAHTIQPVTAYTEDAIGATTRVIDGHPAAAPSILPGAKPTSAGLPAKLGPYVKKLVLLAEEMFGPGTGETKKAWVEQGIKSWLHAVPTGPVPAFIADPIEDLLVDAVIEIAWQTAVGDGLILDASSPQIKA